MCPDSLARRVQDERVGQTEGRPGRGVPEVPAKAVSPLGQLFAPPRPADSRPRTTDSRAVPRRGSAIGCDPSFPVAWSLAHPDPCGKSAAQSCASGRRRDAGRPLPPRHAITKNRRDPPMRELGLILGTERSDRGTSREIRSPYDARTVGRIAFGDAAVMQQAIELANQRFPDYAREPLHRRIGWLRGIAAGIERHAEEIAHTIADEAGKPIRLARLEATRAPATFRAAADESAHLDGELLSLDKAAGGEGRLGLVRRVPAGPVGAVSPFNFPLNLASHKVAAALAAGNPVVLKPASQTPMTAVLLGRIALEAGLPEGVLSVIPCSAREAAPLIVDPRIKVFSFTGSAEVGWKIKSQAPEKRITLELGGNAGAIVEPDADIAFAAQRLSLGGFMYAGQICISVQRIFVHEQVAEPFLEALVRHAREEIACGDPQDENVVCGPMIDAANADRVADWIARAVEAGGQASLPSTREGNLLSPAILRDVPREQPISCREAFGPVVVVETYREFEEALTGMNDSDFGLQAAIFTRDVGRVLAAFDTLEVGGIIHNDYPTFRVDPMPYGGVKQSGFGREGPRYAIEEMMELRLLVLRR
ncbi:MAG: aldehyde dehydrogenase family protein [Candidatus Eisenbacteria bacterium]|nr:aldehyde dehydrogenase family protein [Candidatus Eisenbacteria bacterium]